MRRKTFTVYGYFNDHGIKNKYQNFCAWYYNEMRKSTKNIDDEKELEELLEKWKVRLKIREEKFEIRPFFLKIHTDKEYRQFHLYCRNRLRRNFRSIKSEAELMPIVAVWEEYEKERRKYKKFCVSREFKSHPEYGPFHGYYNWHKEKFGTGVRNIPEDVHKARIAEYIRKNAG